MLMMAIGPKSLELAGRVADGVVLHTFFTDETLARAVRTIRDERRARRQGPGSGPDLVGAGHRRGVDPRGAAAAQAGRPAGHLPAGVRRGAGPRERLGSGGPRAVPQRRAGAGLPRRVRRHRHRRGAQPPARRRAARASGWRPSATGSAAAVRPARSRTSSTPARTAWCCTARPRPSSRRSWPPGARCDRTGWTGCPTTPAGCARPATGRTAPAGRARPRSPRPCGPTRAARSR